MAISHLIDHLKGKGHLLVALEKKIFSIFESKSFNPLLLITSNTAAVLKEIGPRVIIWM